MYGRLKKLDLWPVEERRNRVDLIEVLKMYTELSILKFNPMLKSYPNAVADWI